MAAPLYTTESGRLFHAGKILVVAVGLPARGKTHISRALERYLRWMGVTTQVFSLGDYRRKRLGSAPSLPPDYFTNGRVSSGDKSPETQKLRREIKDGCEQLILDFYSKEKGQVAIYDANNATKLSRQNLTERFEKEGVHIIFLESLCDDQETVMANIRSVKITSPDYKNWPPEEAVKDYMSRIKDHERYYQPMDEGDKSYIKIINVSERMMVNRIQGYLQSRIVFFLQNIHNKYRTIYLARSGQSLIEHSYKADSDLSPAGWEYAERLKEFVLERRAKNLEHRRKMGLPVDENKLVVWTSARRRSHHTAWPFLHSGYRVVEKPIMSEINPGIWDGLSPELARERYPDEWERFLKDPYAHRAPRAESYHDLSVRLEPVIMELEREQDDLLIIGHASVIRCLLAYLIGLPASEVPAVEIARGDLVEVQPASYGVHSQAFHFWSGPGRSHENGEENDGTNYYENYAEATAGKRVASTGGATHMEALA
ncbi:6-phosphofructo-2-kinase-domain-containing protein [Cantharellus anzutake]|uniref:6-phosphofructo-2-kinase-domain-containing protein n=1 Tax=Cantharellus anzutake TaxID=1750568 RepID=UPI0019056A27|nr:6-phosphofructo-2-kinase-domain-containing protein [Cantharellus anzutake]KAF8330355.1 6-phosphofructo-2-kinase-domain-containing protein [Cantharellus anzutake]